MSNPQLYFIALLPPPALREEVKALKEEMRDRFGAQHALKSPAHLTLQMPFKYPLAKASDLISGLTTFAALETAFTIHLKGFDCFAPRVIFLKVDQHEPIINLHDRLTEYLVASIGITTDVVNTRFHPHLTIATRDLRKLAFREAWAEFQNRPFSASFEVKSLFLLKHNGQVWDIYREFLFE